MDEVSYTNLTPDQLREFIKSRSEDTYQLIDVREPREYEEGHIPGAVLIPLREIEDRFRELSQERETIFYCRSGGWSRVAIALSEDNDFRPRTIYNLDGGILAWDGKTLTEVPRVQVFLGLKDIESILLKAIDLEKGAYRFYRTCAEKFSESPFAPTARELAQMEEQHARVLYRMFKRQSKEAPQKSFEELFASMPGNVLEGGLEMDEAVAMAKGVKGGALNLCEIAFEIEYRAYELYRSLAFRYREKDEEQQFLTLAKQEKAHIMLLSKRVPDCL